jgi:hypothetical protein
VAGRDAYTLTLEPRTDQTLVGKVEVDIDAHTWLPLRAAVFARGAAGPAVSAGFTSVDFGPIDPSIYHFTPPPGTKVIRPGSRMSGPAVGSAGYGPGSAVAGPPEGDAPGGSPNGFVPPGPSVGSATSGPVTGYAPTGSPAGSAATIPAVPATATGCPTNPPVACLSPLAPTTTSGACPPNVPCQVVRTRHHRRGCCSPPNLHGSADEYARTFGSGWATVVAYRIPSRQQLQSAAGQGIDPMSFLPFSGPLFSVRLAVRGDHSWILAGAVPQSALERASAELP